MKVGVDTNILVRSVVRDDPGQAALADDILRQATLLAVAPASLCEFAWVLRRVYKFPLKDIARAIRALLAVATVRTDRPAVEAGLAALEAGGDFADGVMAHQTAWLGGEIFITFDHKAAAQLQANGQPVRVIG